MAWVYRDTAVGQSCFANAVLPRCFSAMASSISGEAMGACAWDENGSERETEEFAGEEETPGGEKIG